MKEQQQEDKKYLLWSEDWKTDDNMMEDWWKELIEDEYAGVYDESDLAGCLGLDMDKLTEQEKKALTALIPAYTKEQNDEPDEERWYDEVNGWLDDTKDNLDWYVEGCIIGLADAGLWDGRRIGAGIVGNNIKDCIGSVCTDGDMDIWGEKDGLHISVAHHDGTNYYLFRIAKDRDTARDLQEKILEMEREGKTHDEIEEYFNKHTKSLFPEMVKIYGWD